MPQLHPSTSSSRRLRVAHVITGLGVGGAEMMLTRLVGAPGATQVDDVVLSLTDGGALSARIEAGGVPVHALGMQSGRPSLAALAALRRQLVTIRPDVVQTWLYHADLAGLLAARLAGVSRVIWNIRCSTLDDSDRPPALRALQRALALLSGWPSVVVTNSAEGRRAHEQLGYRPRQWALIPNGIDTVAFAPDAGARAQVREALGLAADAVVVGIVGRAHAMKDHASFLRAAASVAAHEPATRFVMVGRDIAREPGLASLAAAVGEGRVIFAGERLDVQRLFAAMDLLVSSSAWGEGFPNALAEAMSCGVPVVTTDVGDSATIVGHTGRVVPPRDTAALAGAMTSMVGLDAAARRALGAQARARVEAEYSLDAATRRYRALYAQVAGERAA